MATEPLTGDGNFHTLAEAAKILGISIKTLRSHIELGRIRSVIVGNGKKRKTRRITDKNIASFTEKQKVRETPPCQSTGQKAAPTITHASSAKVIAFTNLLKHEPKKKQR